MQDKPRISCGRLNTCDFVCGTMSHAKSSLHWSVIHNQVTFEWHSGCGSERSILYQILKIVWIQISEASLSGKTLFPST